MKLRGRLIASLIGGLWLLLGTPAAAQSPCSTIAYGVILTAGQWQACFSAKQDNLGYAPVNKAGDVYLGRLVFPASNTAGAMLNLPQGAAPITPHDGDIWTTSAGVSAQINGQTVSLGNVGGTGPGGSTNAIQYNSSGLFGGFSFSGDVTVSVPSGVATVQSFNGGTPFGTAAGQNISFPLPSNQGGTGVNNSSFTITLLENLSLTGGSSLQLNTSGITNATFPSGTHTMASLDGVGQSLTGGATIPAGNTQITTGNYTVNCANGPIQWQLNAGNWTITAPTAGDSSCIIETINAAGNASAIGVPSYVGFAPITGQGFIYANTPTQASVPVTVTAANPGVVSWTNHGLTANSKVYFTSGTMPGGLSQYVVYYVVGSSITTNTFQVSAAPYGAAINTSSTGSSVLGFEPSVWRLRVTTINGQAEYNWQPVQ